MRAESNSTRPVHRSPGCCRDHTLEFAFTSPGNEERRITEFRGDVRAEGALDLGRRSWSGDLTDRDIVFPDGAARLIQPAALVLGPDFQRASPVCLRTDLDARLCVEGENRAQPASWRVHLQRAGLAAQARPALRARLA